MFSVRPQQRWLAPILLPAIGVLALALRWKNHELMSLWYDEGWSLVLVQQDWETMLRIIRTDDHPPLYYLLLRRWLAWSPYAPEQWLLCVAWARELSIVLGLLLLPVIYLFAAQLFDRRAGLAAAALAACSPFLIHYQQEVRMYALLALLGTLAYRQTWRLAERWRWRTALGWIAAVIGILLTHYYGLAAVIGLFCCLLHWRLRQTGEWGRALVTLGLVGLLTCLIYRFGVCWLKWFFVQLLNNTSGGVHSFKGDLTMDQTAAYYLEPFLVYTPNLPLEWLYPRLGGQLAPLVKILLCVILVGGLWLLALYAERDNAPLLIFLGWGLVFPLLFTLFYQYALHGRLFGRMLIIYWPLLLILLARGLLAVPRRAPRAVLALLVLLFFYSSWRAYSTNDVRSVMRFVYQHALRPRPELPVYHTSQHSLFPSMAYDGMNTRHYFAPSRENSMLLLPRLLAGPERWLAPSAARRELRFPCLFVVYEEVYYQDEASRNAEKERRLRANLLRYLPPDAAVRVIYQQGRRKWCAVALVERPAPAE